MNIEQQQQQKMEKLQPYDIEYEQFQKVQKKMRNSYFNMVNIQKKRKANKKIHCIALGKGK